MSTSTTFFPAPPRKLRVEVAQGKRIAFRPDIEGLRAIAVLSVLAFHAAIPGFHGGFVGVDIFFVISGYLITAQLFAERHSPGGISIGRFYARRARRILPPAALVLGVTTIVMYKVLPPLADKRFLSDIVASLGYVANWHFIAQGRNYLDSTQSDSVVLHFWSLAVEEQFYLVWPFLILLILWVARRMRVASEPVILNSLALVTAASFVASDYLTRTDPGLAYMATYTRAWQFGVGGVLAVLLAPWRDRDTGTIDADPQVPSPIGLVLGVAGLGAIAWSLMRITETTPYPGLASLAPTLGTAALIAAGPTALVPRLIANPVFRAIGRWSFSWYLWHWPVLIIAEQQYGALTWPVKLALTAGSGLLALLSYRFIEAPSARLARAPRELRSSFVAAATAMLMAAGAIAYVTDHTNQSLAKEAAGALPVGNTLDPDVYRTIFLNPHPANAGPVTPSPVDARNDLSTDGNCQVDQSTLAAVCSFGIPGGKPVVLFGDSHIDQWRPAMIRIAKKRLWSVTEFTESGCPAEDLIPTQNVTDHFAQADCASWRTRQIARIVAMKPAIVVVSSYNHYTPDQGALLRAWRTTLGQLARSGAEIVYLADTPFPGSNVPECISGALEDWAKCAFTPIDRADPVAAAITAGQLGRVRLADMYPVLCPGTTCAAVRDGVLIYRDETHITATAAQYLAYPLDEALTRAMSSRRVTK